MRLTAGVTPLIIVRKVTQLRRLGGASHTHVARRVKLYSRNLQNLAVESTILLVTSLRRKVIEAIC